MGTIKYIDSTKNPTIKEVVLVKEKSRWRRKTGKFVVEGKRELAMACKGGYSIEKVFYLPEITALDEVNSILAACENKTEFIEVSKSVYSRIAYREKTEGIVALGHARDHDLSHLKFNRENPLILVAESIEKPGNIGALLRTADAASLDAVIISNPKTDLYNPNVIRSSLGCVFTSTIVLADSIEVIKFLREKNIKTFAAELGADQNYSNMDFKHASAIVVGGESTGLSDDWIEQASHNVIIPMRGEIDSMNVSVSAAILIFEAMRQRNFR